MAMQSTVRPFAKTRPVFRSEITEQTRQAIDADIALTRKRPGGFLFHSRRGKDRCLSTRQYARLLASVLILRYSAPTHCGEPRPL
jgi:hypothetical protein